MSPDIRSARQAQKNNVRTPRTLYKYYAFDKWTQNIFERNEIYFQSPDCFNDPYDSKIAYTYEGTEEQRISRLTEFWRKGPAKHKAKEDLRSQAVGVVNKCQDIPLIVQSSKRSAERIRKQMGIFCMTRKKNNILMWSHYADDHRGFCLEFKTANAFFRRVLPVDYASARACLNLIKSPDSDKMANALLTKAAGWRYEREWRIIDHQKGPGVQVYPPESLSGVILGCRVSPQSRQLITQWCQMRNPRPTL